MKAFFLPAAEAEHMQQIQYYESKQPGLGARYLDEVVAALERIRESPRRFPVVRPPMLRRLALHRFPFSIIFREFADSVQIVAIAHHRRAPGYWAKRL